MAARVRWCKLTCPPRWRQTTIKHYLPRQGKNCLPINMMLATRCKALGRGTGLGVGETGNPQYTITAGHEHAVAYKVEEQEDVENGSAVH